MTIKEATAELKPIAKKYGLKLNRAGQFLAAWAILEKDLIIKRLLNQIR